MRHGQQLTWDISEASPGILEILPGMQLDVVLHHPNPADTGPRRVVIDTKFTSITKPGQYREALSSGYLYQIYAYLMSQATRDPSTKSEGLMLHPSVGHHVDEEVVIQGHRIRFATVDLAAPPEVIVEELLSAITPREEQLSAAG